MKLQLSYFRDDAEDKISRKVFLTLAGVLIGVFLIFSVIGIVFQNYYEFIIVKGPSMQNTLNDNPAAGFYQDGVYVKKTKTDVTYGDIIVLDKHGEEKQIIKRALAFEGDKITIAKVEVNGESTYRFMRIKRGTNELEVVEEDYIKSYEDWNNVYADTEDSVEYERDFYYTFIKDRVTTTYSYQGRDYKFAVVGEGRVFYMGDNRTNSTDSRKSGTAPMSSLIGRVTKIARNVFCFENSPFFLFNYVGSYFSVIWDEIVSYFSF